MPPSALPTAELLAPNLACLSLAGRLLVYLLDELKHQPKGGRGLTLMDLEPKDALVSVAAFTQSLQVLGTGRGAKPKEEILKGTALATYVGKRARKGKPLEGIKGMRVLAV